ncbi:hypothetical protein B0H14DRAFT_2771152 [Mycena olivaceomarginata]|nr:hypothetical protein B0H14DRAFT_2771152 [Mycena olivaceomarginata]
MHTQAALLTPAILLRPLTRSYPRTSRQQYEVHGTSSWCLSVFASLPFHPRPRCDPVPCILPYSPTCRHLSRPGPSLIIAP